MRSARRTPMLGCAGPGRATGEQFHASMNDAAAPSRTSRVRVPPDPSGSFFGRSMSGLIRRQSFEGVLSHLLGRNDRESASSTDRPMHRGIGSTPMMHGIFAGVDLLGYVSSALVLLTFSLRSLIALRSVAIASNVTFIAYASAAHLQPVLVLHAALLPINVWRLCQCVIARTRTARLRARLAGDLERRRS